MRERLVARRGGALAFALAAGVLARAGATPARAATPTPAVQTVPIAGAVKPLGSFSCVSALRESHAANGYASRYVTDGAYAYGQWRTGAFGGQSLWKKHDAQWCKMETGLATLDRATIVRFGVPAATARRLVAKMHAVGDIAPAVAPTPFASLAPTPRRAKHR